MSERDPRRDPKPGDVLGYKHWIRTVTHVGEWRGWPHAVCYLRQFFAYDPHEGTARTLAGWRRWAKNAEVITIAKESANG